MSVRNSDQQMSQMVLCLKSKRTRDRMKMHYSERIENVDDLVQFAIAGNTFRAFRNLPMPPSAIFRAWCKPYLKRSLVRLRAMDDQAKFDRFVHNAAQSLRKYWRRHARAELDYGRAAKLINLVF